MTTESEATDHGVTPIEAARARDREKTSNNHDSDPDAKKTEPRLWSASDLAEDITRRAAEPWVPLALDGGTLVKVPLGEIAVLVGPTGSGKSTLALAMAVAHARDRGPSLYLSCEMPPAFVGGRVVGQALDRTWPEVLHGAIDTDVMTAAGKPPMNRTWN